MITHTNGYNFYQLSVLVLLLCFISFVISACAISGQKLEMSREVNDIFESGEIISEYNYYYSGPESRPRAIVAISKDVSFEQDLWNAVEPSEDLLDRWNLHINNRYQESNFYFGAYILDPVGRRVGLWYSYETLPTIIWSEEDKKVTIYTPDIHVFPWKFHNQQPRDKRRQKVLP